MAVRKNVLQNLVETLQTYFIIISLATNDKPACLRRSIRCQTQMKATDVTNRPAISGFVFSVGSKLTRFY